MHNCIYDPLFIIIISIIIIIISFIIMISEALQLMENGLLLTRSRVKDIINHAKVLAPKIRHVYRFNIRPLTCTCQFHTFHTPKSTVITKIETVVKYRASIFYIYLLFLLWLEFRTNYELHPPPLLTQI